jgi:hypothetical protein
MSAMVMVDSLSAVSASATPIAGAAAARSPPAFAPAQTPQPRQARRAAVSQQLAILPTPLHQSRQVILAVVNP